MAELDRDIINGGMILKMMMVVVAVSLAINIVGGRLMAAAEVHHVVGDDQGWTTSSDLASWLSGRVFLIGFAYSSASESVMEVKTQEEFMTCDLTNPIKMYTKGLDKVSLDTQGTRFFTSSNLESCKNGLKLPVNVQPQAGFATQNQQKQNILHDRNDIVADGPTSPSGAAHFTSTSLPLAVFVGFLVFYMGFE
ncbi:OLC1v1020829C1 [Oldenlandia corymbosa var. corymbosa]|uniref:OLC1v1020829C1 n=1 Tax=Oldenlandia corymbosa var. corymbosa TaxID=529605 RepID=A0AAV1BWR6_OLDCO|nr:OLC1v1020829C1 [Oldenlandia corymbosa var. corymbosa]